MKNLLVAKEVNYGADSTGTAETAVNPADLLAGSVGIYGLHSDTYRLVTRVAATGTGKVNTAQFVAKQMQLAVGKEGSPDTSTLIDLAGIKSVMAVEYEGDYEYAKSTLTITPAASPSAKDEYNLRLGYRDPNTQQYTRATYSVQGSFANATALSTALRDVVNADPNAEWTASLATADLVLTSKKKTISTFDVGYDGDFASFSEAHVSAQNESLGDPFFLKQLEKETLAYKGTADQITSYIPSLGSQVQNGVNYAVYFFQFANDGYPKGSQKKHFDVEGGVYVAIPAPTTDAVGQNHSEFERILEALGVDFTRLAGNPV